MVLKPFVGLFSVVIPLVLSACKSRTNNDESDPLAYGNTGIHLVVAAKPDSTQQRLWICSGNDVAPGSSKDGYPVSIGIGTVGDGANPNIPLEQRNRENSNLTPAGMFEISEMIGEGTPRGENCSSPGFLGMTTRCMGLQGLELGINENASARGIFIHGTPEGNYAKLGRSASHGCVRMNNDDVVAVFDYKGVRAKTKVYISSLEARFQSGQHACTFSGKPGRGAPAETAKQKECTAPNLAVFGTQGKELSLVHGARSQYRPKAVVDTTTARKDGMPYKLSLSHDAKDNSNLALKTDDEGKTLTGFRYNLSWDPAKKIAFTATWNCDGWVGFFEKEPATLIP